MFHFYLEGEACVRILARGTAQPSSRTGISGFFTIPTLSARRKLNSFQRGSQQAWLQPCTSWLCLLECLGLGLHQRTQPLMQAVSLIHEHMKQCSVLFLLCFHAPESQQDARNWTGFRRAKISMPVYVCIGRYLCLKGGLDTVHAFE